MTLIELKAAFSQVSGTTRGRYRYVAYAVFKTTQGFAYQKLVLDFQPSYPPLFLKNFEINMDGAWRERDRIVSPHNPLPDELQDLIWSIIRNVFDNYNSLKPCISKGTGQPNGSKVLSHEHGQVWVKETQIIRKIDFDNFEKLNKGKIGVIAENGVMNF